MMPNQISSRVDLVSSKERALQSEKYSIQIRPLLKNFLYKKYPDIKFRLLEDPPGPPTLATFHIKIKGQEDLGFDELTHFSEAIKTTVRGIEKDEKLVDLTDTISSPYKKIEITLDDDSLALR